jgi:hypothetical protein
MTGWRTRIRRDRARAPSHSHDSSGNDAPSLISNPATPAKEAVRKSTIDWIDFARPRLREGKLFETAAEPVLGPRSARTRGRPPQDEGFLSAIKGLPHAEERPGARLEARTTSLLLCFRCIKLIS